MTLTIDDVLNTINSNYLYFGGKDKDVLISFNDNNELIIYNQFSRFNNTNEYNIPIYKPYKSTGKWEDKSAKGRVRLLINLNDNNGKILIEFNINKPDEVIYTTSKNKETSKTKENFVIISKNTYQNELDIPKKEKLREQENIVKYIVISYYAIFALIFFLILKLTSFFGSMPPIPLMIMVVGFVLFLHFKTKSILIFYLNKNINKIKDFIYK